MIDTAIDGCPLIFSSWPKSTGDNATGGTVHTLDETAAYMRQHGMPNANEYAIRQIEKRALRKLRHNPLILKLRKECA